MADDEIIIDIDNIIFPETRPPSRPPNPIAPAPPAPNSEANASSPIRPTTKPVPFQRRGR